MNRDIIDGRMERELRRRQLAMRLIQYQARTQTIEEHTGLTRHQLATFRRQAGVSTRSRSRGPAPTSFEVFFSCARARSESAVLALLHLSLGASKFSKPYGSSYAAIESGERLCDVYETWMRLFPRYLVEFEQLTLLGEGVSRGDQISFGSCKECRALLLVDLFGARRRLCDHCVRSRRDDTAQCPQAERKREDDETDITLYGLQLLGGQLLHERKGSYTLEDGPD